MTLSYKYSVIPIPWFWATRRKCIHIYSYNTQATIAFQLRFPSSRIIAYTKFIVAVASLLLLFIHCMVSLGSLYYACAKMDIISLMLLNTHIFLNISDLSTKKNASIAYIIYHTYNHSILYYTYIYRTLISVYVRVHMFILVQVLPVTALSNAKCVLLLRPLTRGSFLTKAE